ncbi:hypothetical protein AJ79_04655 [Helicocarpus griseus UAMH5409]|uniref:Zn(2)-C6 fungal-type domain-containing protein n=1 Tax=Helicocarpus griseus UAMH5409 TaxID=1447875 RepID=A0A2B7XTE8_9EURO|nr:hypothetical protein AJ79_04655 [Helicocarpus griseus UAMH5409]
MAEFRSLCEGKTSPPLKKRKIRKGTQSCWECKRRKIRCTFASPTKTVCDGCKSRQIECVSQEFDYRVETRSTRTDRLDRVEALVEELANRAVGTKTQSLQLPGNRRKARAKTTEGSVRSGASGVGPNIQNRSDYDPLCEALLAVWPSQNEFDLITNLPVGISVLFHGVVCKPYASLLEENMPSVRDMLQLPPPGSHPVLIARKLLMLGSFLQGIPAGAVEELGRLSTNYRQIMSSLVETASKLVTSEDDLVGSLEGIECIMIESMYHNNAGNLRRAWVTNRRAITIAQMMGIHLRGSPLTKILNEETRSRIEPEGMWFRLIITDRYLSLMLALPQAISENPFAVPKELENCNPLERMERIEAVVGGLILQRNKNVLHNLDSTHEIDKLLQNAAASMPSQWWLTPDVTSIAGSDSNSFGEILRLMNQFTHYHLLAQLHLPYLLQKSMDRRHDYSKMTTVNASREILSRFVLFRGENSVPSYCRGVDFLAFIASTTLCLAHIDSRQPRRADESDVLQLLTHQRPGDRGLIERTLLSMEKMASVNNDTIACQIARILRRLLTTESMGVAEDSSFKTNISPGPGGMQFPYGNCDARDGDNVVEIQIPYFGTIAIEYGGALNYSEDKTSLLKGSIGVNLSSEPLQRSDTRHSYELNSITSREEPLPQGEKVLSAVGSPARDQFDEHPNESTSVTNKENFPLGEDNLSGENMSIPGLALDVDDWALQGVDMALFDCLIRGSKDLATA